MQLPDLLPHICDYWAIGRHIIWAEFVSPWSGVRIRESSYYNSANLCLSVFPSFCLSLDLHENRLHGSLQTRPMYCSQPDDVHHDLSLYGCGQIIKINDFVWYSVWLHRRQCCCRPFRRRWRTLLPYWRASQGGSKRRTFSETVDNRRTICGQS